MTYENDCWLYIVEKHGNDYYKVLPIHIPALLAKIYELTVSLWRFAVIEAIQASLEDEIIIRNNDAVEVE
ncbi:hypothetical protein ACTHO0_18895 [Cytobacillus praedii]|uniref:hypothetical protein n=1 Tax=Cytobacillus praedii TaxID=1742358 RepID=UPI003F817146